MWNTQRTYGTPKEPNGGQRVLHESQIPQPAAHATSAQSVQVAQSGPLPFFRGELMHFIRTSRPQVVRGRPARFGVWRLTAAFCLAAHTLFPSVASCPRLAKTRQERLSFARS